MHGRSTTPRAGRVLHRAVGVRTPSRTSRKRMHTRTPGQSQHSGMVSGMVSVMVNVVLGRASVAAIATAAGTSKQTVFARFGSKERLFIAVSDGSAQRPLFAARTQWVDLAGQFDLPCIAGARRHARSQDGDDEQHRYG